MRRSVWVRSLIVGATAGAVAATSLAAYGYVLGFDDPKVPAAQASGTVGPTTTSKAAVVTSTTKTTPTTIPTTTTTHAKMKDPPRAAMPEVPANGLGEYSSGDVVAAYETRLKSLRFDPGTLDGRFDQNMRYAVEAVQKLYGLPRTGRIDAATRVAIAAFKYPKPLVAEREPDRVEIDLDRQVLIVWTDWKITLITTTSTGSGKHFCGGDQGCQYAVTPVGRYTLTRNIKGWRTGKLGKLWNPYYFNGGIAVHGLASVPVYPASHGCARIPMDIATYFATLVHKGEPVYVVGVQAPRGGISSPGTPRTTPPATAPPTTATTLSPVTTPPTAPPTTKPPATTPTTTKPSTTTVAPTTVPQVTTTT